MSELGGFNEFFIGSTDSQQQEIETIMCPMCYEMIVKKHLKSHMGFVHEWKIESDEQLMEKLKNVGWI